MSQHYSDPARATDPHALPDLEVTFFDESEGAPGWYWAFCFPGCLPDGDWNGPFATEAEAEANMRKEVDQ